MAAVAPPGALDRARTALRGADFRKLFAIRIVGQGGDGFFTVALSASVVFNPSEHSTTFGLFKAALITALPFTILGPFVGVFIDRWQRRHILAYAPLLKVALVGLVLFDPTTRAVPFYVGALAVTAIGMTFVIISGGIDLSVGSVLCLCSMILAVVMHAGYSIEVGIAASLGTALLIGITPPGAKAILDTNLFIGSRTFTRTSGGDCRPDRDFPLFVRWYREGKLKLDDLVTHRYTLDQINSAVEDLEHGRILGRGIITY